MKADAASPAPSQTQMLFEPILDELAEFEERLETAVAADLGPMAEAMRHIVRAGGKRIRPALVILSSRLGQPVMDHVYDLAMGIEFIHTATLVHDDLIDRSPTRRGMTTLHETMGPPRRSSSATTTSPRARTSPPASVSRPSTSPSATR